MTLLEQGGRTRWHPEIPSNLTILWFCEFSPHSTPLSFRDQRQDPDVRLAESWQETTCSFTVNMLTFAWVQKEKTERGPAFQRGYWWVILNAHLAQSIVSVDDDANALGRDNKKVRVRLLSFTHQSEGYMICMAPTQERGREDVMQHREQQGARMLVLPWNPTQNCSARSHSE